MSLLVYDNCFLHHKYTNVEYSAKTSPQKKKQRENLVKSLVRARYGVHECSAKEFLKIFNWTYICSFSKVIVCLSNENALRRNCNWLLLTAHSRYSYHFFLLQVDNIPLLTSSYSEFQSQMVLNFTLLSNVFSLIKCLLFW